MVSKSDKALWNAMVKAGKRNARKRKTAANQRARTLAADSIKDQLEQHRLQGTKKLERVRSAKIKLVGSQPGMREREKKRLQQRKERVLLLKSKNKNLLLSQQKKKQRDKINLKD